jgi:hypothetical protein
MTSPQPQPKINICEYLILKCGGNSDCCPKDKKRLEVDYECVDYRASHSSAAGEAVLDELVGDGWKVSAGGKGDSCIKCHDDLSPPKMQFSYPKNEALHAGILCVHCFADEYKAQLRQQGEACRDCYGSEVS